MDIIVIKSKKNIVMIVKPFHADPMKHCPLKSHFVSPIFIFKGPFNNYDMGGRGIIPGNRPWLHQASLNFP